MDMGGGVCEGAWLCLGDVGHVGDIGGYICEWFVWGGVSRVWVGFVG